jgi:hypothetical protein
MKGLPGKNILAYWAFLVSYDKNEAFANTPLG